MCPLSRREVSIITGRAYVLGDNVDTDQIIPAQYLSFNPAQPEERKFFGMYANSGIPDAQAGLSARADPLIRSGLDKINAGDYRGAIQDLEEARVYLPANDPRLAQIQEALQRARQALTPTIAPSLTATPTDAMRGI